MQALTSRAKSKSQPTAMKPIGASNTPKKASATGAASATRAQSSREKPQTSKPTSPASNRAPTTKPVSRPSTSPNSSKNTAPKPKPSRPKRSIPQKQKSTTRALSILIRPISRAPSTQADREPGKKPAPTASP